MTTFLKTSGTTVHLTRDTALSAPLPAVRFHGVLRGQLYLYLTNLNDQTGIITMFKICVIMVLI